MGFAKQNSEGFSKTIPLSANADIPLYTRGTFNVSLPCVRGGGATQLRRRGCETGQSPSLRMRGAMPPELLRISPQGDLFLLKPPLKGAFLLMPPLGGRRYHNYVATEGLSVKQSPGLRMRGAMPLELLRISPQGGLICLASPV